MTAKEIELKELQDSLKEFKADANPDASIIEMMEEELKTLEIEVRAEKNKSNKEEKAKKEKADKKKVKAVKGNPYNIDSSKDKQKFGKDYQLVKKSDKLYLLVPNNKEYSEYEFELKDDKWTVTCITKDVKTFKTIQGAVNYVGKTLYKQSLKKHIDKAKESNKKSKKWHEEHPDGLDSKEKLDKVADTVDKNTDIKKSLKGVDAVVKAISKIPKDVSKKEVAEIVKEAKKIIVAMQGLIKSLGVKKFDGGGEVDNIFYVIYDNTANTGKPYISDDGSNTGDETSARQFTTEKEAQEVIDNSEWGEWASVMSFGDYDEEYAKGGKINTPLPNCNLYLKGVGHDMNGNRIIRLMFPDEKGFSIQTGTGGTQKTDSILRGYKTSDLNGLSETDLKTIKTELCDYIKEFGSKAQKEKLKIY